MRRLLVLVLAGCGASSGSPGEPIGSPCSLKDPCAKGAVCDLTDPNGAVCIDANGDLDGDGIPNGHDFCEHAAGGLYDEDQDGIGDDCDPCPVSPPPATPDPDGDAVDSPCDPDPRTPGDHILLFDGFNGDALDPRWKATTPTAWSAQGGEAVADLTGLGTEQYLSANPGEALHFALEASYRIDQLDTSIVTHLVAVRATDPRPAGVAQFECGVVHSDQGTGGDVVDLETNLNTASTSATKSGFDTASLYELAAASSAGQVGCTVIGDGAGLGAVQAPITADSLATASLAAQGVKVRFQWVLVIGR